jgi:hypothetical protein
VKAGNLALGIIREAEPRQEAVLEVGATIDASNLDKLGLSELIALAEQLGIDVSRPGADPSERPLRSLLAERAREEGNPSAGLPRDATPALRPL